MRNAAVSNRPHSTERPTSVRSRSRSEAQDAHRAEHGAQDVGDGGSRAQRHSGRTRHVGETAHHLHDFIECNARPVRTRQKSLQRAIDEAQIEPARLHLAETRALQGAGRHVLDQHIGIAHQPQRLLKSGRRLVVEHNAALVAIEKREIAGAETLQPTRVLAARRLDLQYLGAKIRKHHAAAGAENGVAEFQHTDAGEGQRLKVGGLMRARDHHRDSSFRVLFRMRLALPIIECHSVQQNVGPIRFECQFVFRLRCASARGPALDRPRRSGQSAVWPGGRAFMKRERLVSR